jgi:hypothetical protein
MNYIKLSEGEIHVFLCKTRSLTDAFCMDPQIICIKAWSSD